MKYVMTNNFGMSQFIEGYDLYDAVLSAGNIVGKDKVSIMEYSEWIRFNKIRMSWYFKLAQAIVDYLKEKE